MYAFRCMCHFAFSLGPRFIISSKVFSSSSFACFRVLP
nr:MAG TPA: hypothetical protein [Caudoviricetes sp.]